MSKYMRQSPNAMGLPPAYEGLQTSKEIEPPSAEDLGTDNRGLVTTPQNPQTGLFGIDENTIKLIVLAVITVVLVYFLK